jgi:hypothetical protein
MSDIFQATVEKLLTTGRGLAKEPVIASGCAPVVIVPAGFDMKELPAAKEQPLILVPLPDHVRQKVTLTELESFVAYANSYQTPLTQIFGRVPTSIKESGEFLAVLDYHKAIRGGESESASESAANGNSQGSAKRGGSETSDREEAKATAQRCAHVVSYPCPLSEAWRTWAAIDRQELDQGRFVDFLEDNMPDIVSPDGAAVLEMAMNFRCASQSEFSSKLDRSKGTVSVSYTEQAEAGNAAAVGPAQKIALIEMLHLSLPVFQGGSRYEVKARLRWNPAGKKLKVTVALQRPMEVLETAFVAVRGLIQADTRLAVLMGSPEQDSDAGSW